MTLNVPIRCKSITGAGIAALVATLLAGCSIEASLPGYTDTPATAPQKTAAPDLLPQEAFEVQLQANLARSTSVLSQREALIARAARLRLWAQR